MEQLTTLEASFLEVENADRHLSLAIGGLAVIEGPMPEFEELIEALSERVRPITRFTQKVRTYPLGDKSSRTVALIWRRGSARADEFRMLGKFIAEHR